MSSNLNLLNSLSESIIDLNSEEACKFARKALSEGFPPDLILNQCVSSALEEVSKRFDNGEYFLSELVMAGEITNDILKEILPAMTKTKATCVSKGTIVIGTVEGDLHDIGKNIVSTFLSASGLNVVDLGVDVPPKRFVEEVKTNKAHIVGLSALLTTTIPAMKKTITELEKAGLRSSVKVIVGGRPVTKVIAKEVGADAYGQDAPEGTRKTLELLGKE